MEVKKIKTKCSYLFSKKRFNEIIKESSLVISNFSSVGIESIAYGVPSIIINIFSNININPIPLEINKNIWNECDSVEKFNLYFDKYYLNHDKDEFESIAKIC